MPSAAVRVHAFHPVTCHLSPVTVLGYLVIP
jgi:hypothetical protein